MDGENTLSVDQSETLQQLQKVNGQAPLPQGTQSHREVDQPEPYEPEPEPIDEPQQAVTETSEGEFEYDGQRFASEKEAFEYLKGRVGQLETERLLDEARLEGQQQALQYIPQYQQTQSTQPPEPEDEIDMDKFYENPKGFLKEYGEKIYKKVRSEVDQAQTAREQQEAVWHEFTKNYPDLADFREDVDAVANAHMDTVTALARRDRRKAMDYVATKTREKFQRYVEAMKPRRTLPNTKQTVSSGGYQGVTRTQKQSNVDKPLDFATQLRQARKR